MLLRAIYAASSVPDRRRPYVSTARRQVASRMVARWPYDVGNAERAADGPTHFQPFPLRVWISQLSLGEISPLPVRTAPAHLPGMHWAAGTHGSDLPPAVAALGAMLLPKIGLTVTDSKITQNTTHQIQKRPMRRTTTASGTTLARSPLPASQAMSYTWAGVARTRVHVALWGGTKTKLSLTLSLFHPCPRPLSTFPHHHITTHNPNLIIRS